MSAVLPKYKYKISTVVNVISYQGFSRVDEGNYKLIKGELLAKFESIWLPRKQKQNKRKKKILTTAASCLLSILPGSVAPQWGTVHHIYLGPDGGHPGVAAVLCSTTTLCSEILTIKNYTL